MADIKKKLVDGAGLQAAMGIMADYADKGVRGAIGGYNQSFPLTAATKGNIYYHKGTNRYYICVDNYNGSSLTNPNSKFEELSVYTNRQRLDNLITIVFSGNFYIHQNMEAIIINDQFSYVNSIYKALVVGGGSLNNGEWVSLSVDRNKKEISFTINGSPFSGFVRVPNHIYQTIIFSYTTVNSSTHINFKSVYRNDELITKSGVHILKIVKINIP